MRSSDLSDDHPYDLHDFSFSIDVPYRDGFLAFDMIPSPLAASNFESDHFQYSMTKGCFRESGSSLFSMYLKICMRRGTLSAVRTAKVSQGEQRARKAMG